MFDSAVFDPAVFDTGAAAVSGGSGGSPGILAPRAPRRYLDSDDTEALLVLEEVTP